MAFYKITAPNGQISYVYGTFHGSDATANKLSKEVAEAFEKSSTLLVEADMDQGLIRSIIELIEAKTRWNTAHLAAHTRWLANPQNVSDAFTQLAKHYSWYVPRSSIASTIKQQSPVFLAIQLTYLSHMDSSYLDKNLAIKAKKNHKTIVGLQPVSELLDLFMGLAHSYEEQRRVFELIINDYSHAKTRLKKQELTKAYLEDRIGGEYQFIENTQQNPLIDRFNSAILHDRDVIMSDRLEGYFQSGNAFVAVGAAHLPGIKSIFEQKPGYRVEEVIISERIYPVLDYASRHFSQMLATGALVMAGGAGLALGLIVSPYLLALGLLIASAALLALALLLTVKLLRDYMQEPLLSKAVPAVTVSQNGFFAPSAGTNLEQLSEKVTDAVIDTATAPLMAQSSALVA